MSNPRNATLPRGERLIIRISPGSLSFTTTGAGQVNYERYALKSSISIAANMREALRNTAVLDADYQHVAVMVDSPVLMMPADLYNKDEQEELYGHTFTRLEGMTVVSYVLPSLNAVALFTIHRDLRQVLTERFNNLSLIPAVAPVWNHMHQKSFTGVHQKLYGYFHDHHVEVFSFQQNRFKFCNSYSIGNDPNDALYYLLSAWKQLGMEPREDELHLCGNLPEREQLTEEARRYVKRVFITNPSGEFNRASVTQIEGMPYDLMLFILKN